MRAAADVAFREAMQGATRLLQMTSHSVPLQNGSDAPLAAARAQLVTAYDPATEMQPTGEAWLTKVDSHSEAYG